MYRTNFAVGGERGARDQGSQPVSEQQVAVTMMLLPDFQRLLQNRCESDSRPHDAYHDRQSNQVSINSHP
jgi:hypothetical protein